MACMFSSVIVHIVAYTVCDGGWVMTLVVDAATERSVVDLGPMHWQRTISCIQRLCRFSLAKLFVVRVIESRSLLEATFRAPLL
jgi:hypothetical protein